MKSGFGFLKKLRQINIYKNLTCFNICKYLLGFENANLYLRKIDKNSLKLILKKNGAKIGENCDIENGLIFHNCNDYSNLVIGDNCHIGKNCFFDLREKIELGNNVVISMQSTVITHIDLNKSFLSTIYSAKSRPVTINDNSYLGAKTMVLMGTEIGKNSFVAAGSVVTKSIPENKLIAGVPAKIIRSIS